MDKAPNQAATHQVTETRWKEAQKFELKFAQGSANLGNDDNEWWFNAFDQYRFIEGKRFVNVLEVGCGPHTNCRLILPLIRYDKLWLEDPLINEYLRLRRKRRVMRIISIKTYTAVSELVYRRRATPLAEKLEHLSLPDKTIDLCICINVLDHVQDVELCLTQLRRVLGEGGILLMAQDLSHEQDFELCPESWTDVGHPIKIDADFLDTHLGDLKPLFKKILPRSQGRNPRCHYGTYLLAGQHNSPKD